MSLWLTIREHLYSITYIYAQGDIFIFNILYLYSTIRIFFQLQTKLFSFNKNICSTSTKNRFIEHFFNFNQNYFHSTTVFVQLQPKIISFNKNICFTLTKNNFIQQKYLFNLTKIIIYSTVIIIQLPPRLFSFNNNSYSTSTMHSELITYLFFYDKLFEKSPRTFKILSFNKIPCPVPSQIRYSTDPGFRSQRSWKKDGVGRRNRARCYGYGCRSCSNMITRAE